MNARLILYISCSSFGSLDAACKATCGGICKIASLHDRCLRACDTSGNKNLGPCYANMKNTWKQTQVPLNMIYGVLLFLLGCPPLAHGY